MAPAEAVGAALLILAETNRLHHDPLQLEGAPDPRLRRVALSALQQAANDARAWTADPSIEGSVTASWIFPPAESVGAPVSLGPQQSGLCVGRRRCWGAGW
jgi:hypothetical protein